MEEEVVGTREAPSMRGRGSQPELREEQAGSLGVADRLVLLMTPGNAGRGRSLTSGALLEETNSPEIGSAYQLHCGLGGHGKNFTCQRRW